MLRYAFHHIIIHHTIHYTTVIYNTYWLSHPPDSSWHMALTLFLHSIFYWFMP